MNKVILIGRLCADVETKSTTSGKMIANYRLAVDRFSKQDGEPSADFLNCVAFEHNADFASRYLRKGSKIAIEGRIRTRDYTNKDGQKVYVTEIVVDRHEFCESKNSAGASTSPAGQPNAAQAGTYIPDAYAAPAAPSAVLGDEEDLPF